MSIYYGTPAEHSFSFVNLNKVISDEAGIALNAFDKLLAEGWTEQEIVDDFNTALDCEENKFKTYAELTEWLRTVGI